MTHPSFWQLHLAIDLLLPEPHGCILLCAYRHHPRVEKCECYTASASGDCFQFFLTSSSRTIYRIRPQVTELMLEH